MNMLREIQSKVLSLLPAFAVEYICVTADLSDPGYSLGVCTRSEAISLAACPRNTVGECLGV